MDALGGMQEEGEELRRVRVDMGTLDRVSEGSRWGWMMTA